MGLQEKLDKLPPQARREFIQKYIDKANMIGMNLEMHSQSPSALGADRYTLIMEDLFV